MEILREEKQYSLIDLHCDTLTDWKYTSTGNKDTLDDPKRVLSLTSIPKNVNWAQFYAIFIPDEIRGAEAINYYEYNKNNFLRQITQFNERVLHCRTADEMDEAWNLGKTAAFLTVENGSVLAGNLDRIKELADDGIKAITLVWNGENELGSGHTTNIGLTNFGKSVVPELENHGIIVDVSHLNDAGFKDLLKIAKKPFMATHSNARAICQHKRNLTDDMIREMVDRQCLIGLNYYINFIKDDGLVNSLDDLFLHVEHFLELGAEKNLALGSDFDGALLPDCLKSPKDVVGLYKYFISKGLTMEQVEGIMFRNAQTFFKKHLT